MKDVEISIIIPVYKAESYLDRCINSIISQSFKYWELLLIDDGSPDKSGEICDLYASKDSRIKVFHKPNGGVSSAREMGIINAKGKYSIHIDPDDWIDNNTLYELYANTTLTNADIVIFDFMLEYGNHHEILSQYVDSPESLLQQLFQQQRHGSLCNKLIKTELYNKYDLHFPDNLICWEDLYICCNLLMLHPCKISYIAKPFYHYDLYSNPGSMARNASLKTLDGMIFFCEYFEKILPNNQKELINETKGMVLVTAYRCKLLTAGQIRNTFPEINKWYVNKYLNDKKHLLYCAVANILNGKSILYTSLFFKINSYFQRIKNKIKKISC